MFDPSDERIRATAARITRSRYLIDRSIAVLALTDTYIARTGHLVHRSADRLAFAPFDFWAKVPRR